MKVTDVACHILQCKVDKPFVSARGWVYGTRSSCVVEICASVPLVLPMPGSLPFTPSTVYPIARDRCPRTVKPPIALAPGM